MEEEDFKDLMLDSDNKDSIGETQEQQTEEENKGSSNVEENVVGENVSETQDSNEAEDSENQNVLPIGVRKRLNKLSQRAREAELRNVELEKRLKSLEVINNKPKSEQDFKTKEDYEIHVRQKELDEYFEKRYSERKRAEEISQLQKNFRALEEKERERFDDYDDAVLNTMDIKVNDAVNEYLFRSPYGARILYTVGKIQNVKKSFVACAGNEQIDFLKKVEQRLIEIDNQLAKKSSNPKQTQKEMANPPKQTGVRTPIKVNGGLARRLNPSTCSDAEWMENED